MTKWNSSPHPISDIRDWSRAGLLELRPDYQRRVVWGPAARIMLIDSILRDIPIPKIFLANTVRDDKTYRVVIDGQQRITAILEFLGGEFCLEAPYEGEYLGKHFSELDRETKDAILSYRIDFNEAINPTEAEVREVYSRVNKYSIPLNRQELRRADFPGDFLELSEQLALNEYLDSTNLFSLANRRRYGDVEFVSELLSAMLKGIQDKKDYLDDVYREFAVWDRKSKRGTEAAFVKVLDELQLLFLDEFKLQYSRFRQKSDFYSIFYAIFQFTTAGYSLENKDLGYLREDLRLLDKYIRPESEIEILSEYAIKCISQANSAASRKWRTEFLSAILSGTYLGVPPKPPATDVYYGILESLDDGQGFCPDALCHVCVEEMNVAEDESLLGWHAHSSSFQLSNAVWVHSKCADDDQLIVIPRPSDNEQQNLF